MSQALHPDDAFNYLVDFLRQAPMNSTQSWWDVEISAIVEPLLRELRRESRHQYTAGCRGLHFTTPPGACAGWAFCGRRQTFHS